MNPEQTPHRLPRHPRIRLYPPTPHPECSATAAPISPSGICSQQPHPRAVQAYPFSLFRYLDDLLTTLASGHGAAAEEGSPLTLSLRLLLRDDESPLSQPAPMFSTAIFFSPPSKSSSTPPSPLRHPAIAGLTRRTSQRDGHLPPTKTSATPAPLSRKKCSSHLLRNICRQCKTDDQRNSYWSTMSRSAGLVPPPTYSEHSLFATYLLSDLDGRYPYKQRLLLSQQVVPLLDPRYLHCAFYVKFSDQFGCDQPNFGQSETSNKVSMAITIVSLLCSRYAKTLPRASRGTLRCLHIARSIAA